MKEKIDPKIPIRTIVEAGGGPTKIGRLLGIDRRCIHTWIVIGAVPPIWCTEIEELTGFSCEDMQPMVWKPRKKKRKSKKSK